MRDLPGVGITGGGVCMCGGVANTNLKNCGVSVTEAVPMLDKSRDQVMRGKWEGEKAGVQGPWECHWEGGFVKPGPLCCALLHAAGL